MISSRFANSSQLKFKSNKGEVVEIDVYDRELSPLRRVDGVSYWVIENPDEIYDFVVNISAPSGSSSRDPSEYRWLQTLSNRRWRSEIVHMDEIRLDPDIIDYVDVMTGYNFAERLASRREQLRRAIETYETVIWPVLVRGEDMSLVDGYCRHITLREMHISKIYTYIGSIQQH